MAAITVSQMKAVLSADISGYTAEMTKAQRQAVGMAQGFKNIGLAVTAAVTVPLVGLATQAVQAATKMDSLKRGLTAVAGSADAAEKQIADLKEVAKLPGLGFEEAIEGSINLQAAGFSAKQAEEALKAFGNALATVGKGKADLDGVTLALTQIAAQGKVTAEEINQLQQRVPQIRQAMKAAFGTANTEELQKMGIGARTFVEGITRELAKLPQVTGGAQNAFENLGDAVKQALSAIGDNILPSLVPVVDRVTKKITELSQSFAKLPEEQRTARMEQAALAASAGPLLLAGSSLISSWKNVAATFTAARAGAGLLGGALRLLTGPIGIVLGAAILLEEAWRGNWFNIQQVTIDVVNTISYTLQEWMNGVSRAWQGFLGVLKGNWANGWNEIKEGTKQVWNGLAEGAKRAGEERAKADEGARIIELNAHKAHAAAIVKVNTGLTDDVKKEKSAQQKQMEQFATAMASVDRQLLYARQRETTQLQQLAGQYLLVDDAHLRLLARKQAELAATNAINDASRRQQLIMQGETQEVAALAQQLQGVSIKVVRSIVETDAYTNSLISFREEMRKVNEEIRARRTGGDELTMEIMRTRQAHKDWNDDQIENYARQVVVNRDLDRRFQENTGNIKNAALEMFGLKAKTLEEKIAVDQFGESLVRAGYDMNKLPDQTKRAIASVANLTMNMVAVEAAWLHASSTVEREDERLAKSLEKLEASANRANDTVKSTFDNPPANAGPRKLIQNYNDIQTALERVNKSQRDYSLQVTIAATKSVEVQEAFRLFPEAFEGVKFGFETVEQAVANLPPAVRTALDAVMADIHKAQRREAFSQLAGQLRGVFEDAFLALGSGFKSFFGSLLDGFRNMLRQLAAEFLASQVLRLIISAAGGNPTGITSTLGKAFLGGRAGGGPVDANHAYIVGEEGPELFMPSSSGNIVPNDKMGAVGQTVHNHYYNINATDAPGVRRALGQIAQDHARRMREFDRRNG